MKSGLSRDRIVTAGVDALSRHGFAGVTIGRVAEASKMSKSGIFAHFKSRQALETTLLDEAAAMANRHVVAPAMRRPAGLPRLRTLIERWFGWAPRAGLPGGCPIAAALFELDDATGAIRNHVATLDGRWRSLLATLVREAVDRGDFVAGTDVDQFVWELCGVYLAHHSFSRFIRDPASDERALRAVDALVDRYQMPSTPDQIG